MATATGLDIGSSAVRATQLSRDRRGEVLLDQLGQVLLPPGAVVDGEIRDPGEVTEALRILWQQFGFKGKRVVMGLANPHVIARRVDMPFREREEIASVVRLQAPEHIPLPMDQVEFDFEFIETFTHDDGTPMMRVMLVAAEKQMVAQTVEVVRGAGLRPVAIDLDPLALVRAVKDSVTSAERFGSGAGEVVVGIGAHLTNVVIHTDGVPRFVRSVDLGGEDVSESLVAAFDVTWEQAETLKSVAPGASSPYTALLGERIAQLVDEVRNSIGYFRSTSAGTAVSRAIVTGGSSLIPDLDLRLSQALNVDVSHGRPFRRISLARSPFAPEEVEAAQPFFGVAVGLALRGIGR